MKRGILILILLISISFVFATTYVITEVFNEGTLTNITSETNYTRLNISTAAPYDSLVLYLNFDENVGTEVQKENNGIWTWYNDPRAMYYKGATYIGYTTSKGDIIIYKYNHSTGSETSYLLEENFEIDDHDNPVITFLGNEKIMVAWSEHNGDSFYRISTNSQDISSWGTKTAIPDATDDAAYSNLFYLSNENKVYHFYRNRTGTGPTNQAFLKYNVATSIWDTSSRKNLINSAVNYPYFKYWSDLKDTIHVAFSNGMPTFEAQIPIYHFYYKSGTYYLTNGTALESWDGSSYSPFGCDTPPCPVMSSSSPPFNPENLTLVNNDTANYRNWIVDLKVVNDIPAITYMYYTDGDEGIINYGYSRWNGTAWNSYNITSYNSVYFGNRAYGGLAVIDYKNLSVVYLSKNVSGIDEIQKWETPNNGSTWINTVNITSNSLNHQRRPFSIWNYSGNINLTWWESNFYAAYTSYDSKIIVDGFGTLTENHAESLLNNFNYMDSVDINFSGNTKTFNTAGMYGNSSDFNRSLRDYVLLNSPKLSNFSSFTISLWAKFIGTTSTNEYNLVDAWVANDQRYLLLYDATSGRNKISFFTKVSSSAGGLYDSTDISDRNWHHVVAVYNGTTMLIYVDNVQSLTTYAQTGTIPQSIYNLTKIGGSLSNRIDNFNGSIDEVMIFNTSLTSTQITSIYNNQSARFYPQGIHSITKNITAGNNTINVLTDYSALMDTSINLTLWHYNGTWNNAGTQVVDGNNSFTISNSSTNVTLNYTYLAEDYLFYSPILKNNITLELTGTTPSVNLISPSNESEAADTSVTLTYNVTDNSSITNCSLILEGVLNSSNTSITKDTSQTFDLTGLTAGGSYNWSVNCTNDVGNTGTSATWVFTVAEEEEGTTDDTTTTIGIPSYYPSNQDIQEGYSKSLGKNWKINFNVKGNSHKLTLNDIKDGKVTITISSDPITFYLGVGEEKKLNLDAEGFYDLLVRLESIEDHYVLRANVFIQEIDEEVSESVNQKNKNSEDLGKETNNQLEGFKGQYFFWIGVLALLFIIGSIIYILIKRKQKNY